MVCIVPSKIEGFFKCLTSINGEPDCGNSGVDEGVDGGGQEPPGGRSRRGRDCLNGDKKITRYIVSEREGDAVRPKAGGIVATEGKRTEGRILSFLEAGGVAPCCGGDKISLTEVLEGSGMRVGECRNIKRARRNAEVTYVPNVLFLDASDNLVIESRCRGAWPGKDNGVVAVFGFC